MLEIGKYKIQPMSIMLFETDKDKEGNDRNWGERCIESANYFREQGIDIYWTYGIHGEGFGIEASRPYQRDVPNTDWRLEPRTVAGYLSGYQILNVALSHPEWEYFAIIEEDCRLVENWRERLTQALEDVDDFDMLYVGSCCTEGRPKTHIKGEVYEVKFPLCGHFTIINRRCLPVLLAGMRNCCIPFDIHLFDNIMDQLKVRTILPRIANQPKTYLPI